MKTTLIRISTGMCLLAFISCNEAPKGNANDASVTESNKVTDIDSLPEKPVDLTELSVALADVKRYRDTCRGRSDTLAVRAFNLNTRDLLSVLGQNFEPDASHPFHARGYIGLDVKNMYKFYIVPVIGDSSRHITITNPGRDTVIVGKYKGYAPNKTQFVYELNFPCPTLCDYSSIFYQASN